MNQVLLEKLQSKIRSLDALPAIPAILQPLLAALQVPADQANLAKIIELVSFDKIIAVQCIRVANSPLYGRSRDVETVKNAVLVLGLQRLQSIVLGRCLNQALPFHSSVCDPSTFWKHSLGCALVARKLATLVGYPDAEKAYLAGLLHDLGILVNFLIDGAEFAECYKVASQSGMPLHKVEYDRMGYSHAQSGKLLVERWHLPSDLGEVVEFHHNPMAADRARALVCLVHLSDLLCRVRDLGHGYYEAMSVDLAGEEAWTVLAQEYPALADLDVARLTFDVDGAIDEITALVESVFANKA